MGGEGAGEYGQEKDREAGAGGGGAGGGQGRGGSEWAGWKKGAGAEGVRK
jgi:hypothetical protein